MNPYLIVIFLWVSFSLAEEYGPSKEYTDEYGQPSNKYGEVFFDPGVEARRPWVEAVARDRGKFSKAKMNGFDNFISSKYPWVLKERISDSSKFMVMSRDMWDFYMREFNGRDLVDIRFGRIDSGVAIYKKVMTPKLMYCIAGVGSSSIKQLGIEVYFLEPGGEEVLYVKSKPCFDNSILFQFRPNHLGNFMIKVKAGEGTTGHFFAILANDGS